MAMFKGFKPQGLQKIATRMGYAGRMEEFDNYLEQNPEKQREMITYRERAEEMARGGAVRKFQVGGFNPFQAGTQAVVYGRDGKQYGSGMIAERAGVTDYSYTQPKDEPLKFKQQPLGGEVAFGGAPVGRGEPILKGDPRFEMPSFESMPQQTKGSIVGSLGLSKEQADQFADGFPMMGTEQFNKVTGGGGFPAQQPNRTAAVKSQQQTPIQYPKSYMSGYTTQDGKAIEAPFKSNRSPLEIYNTKEDYANYASKTYDDRKAYYNNQIKQLTDQGFVLQADGFYRNPKTGGARRIAGFDDVLKQSKEQYVAKQLEAKNRYDAERANSPAGSLDFREQQKASELKKDKENVSKLNENLIKQGLSPVDANFYDSPEYKYYLDNRSMMSMPASGFSKYFGPQNSQEPGGTREKAYEAYLKRTGQDEIINKANNFRDPNIGFLGEDGIIRPIDSKMSLKEAPTPTLDARKEEFMDYFKLPDGGRFAYDRRTRMAVPPGAVGVSKDEYMQIPEKPANYTSLSSVGQPINTSQPIGTTMATDTNIEDFSVQQALNPTLPQGGATVAAGTPITQDQMVDPATGQLRPQAPTVGSAALGTTTTSTAPTATPASTMDASLSNLNVTQALQPIQSAQGSVSQQSQMTAQQQTASKVSELQSAQGTATLMQNPVQREIQAGELISGGVANAEKASTYAEQIEAATATPSAQATVQGQLANLTANFDATNPPAWAAGALRGVQAQMAARGLGTSSMAAQAMIQGALESALPIAQADANTIASFEQANLSNRQQRAMLAAQQRAAFIGQEFDQGFQTRVQNAAKISDIANMNFTAEQQIALENSRAANTMGLANLSNRQAMVMAEASALANLDMSNLNNRQQAAVQNAQAFMQMDMANLNNSQQTGMFKAQSLVQSLFTDQAATNASSQFNATSQNQTDQFFANLQSQVSNFNAEQANAMSRYNSGELNALEQFNANMKNQREQFNAQNRLVIDQSNAQWRRQVATADTATINRANELNARALIELSTGAYNNLWQGFRDDMEFAWKSADNAEERSKDILLRKMQDESTVTAAALAADQAQIDNLTKGLVNLATTKPGGTILEKGFDFITDIDYGSIWDKGSNFIDDIFDFF